MYNTYKCNTKHSLYNTIFTNRIDFKDVFVQRFEVFSNCPFLSSLAIKVPQSFCYLYLIL